MFASITIPFQRSRPYSRRLIFSVAALALLCLGFAANAAAQNQTSLEVYANAMKQPQVSEQIAGLERFLSMGESGILKQDALEVLIWDYSRMGSLGHAQQRAADLLKLDPGNPVAIATQSRPPEQPAQSRNNKSVGKERIDAAQRALTAMEALRKPEGMLPGDFAALRRHVESTLNGALGLAYVDRQQYQLARTPLQQAAAVDPANPQYAYALGLALLYSGETESQNAFLYLARAADLTKGTPAGQQIAEFARKQYHKAGGTDADWSRYLAAAVVPSQERARSPIVASNSQPAPSTTTFVVVGNSQPPPQPSPTTAKAPTSQPSPAVAPNIPPGVPGASPSSVSNAQPKPSSSAPAVAANPAQPQSNPNAASNPQLSRKAEAKLVPPALPPSAIPSHPAGSTDVDSHGTKLTPEKKPGIVTPYEPVSLGILIETALLTKHNRPAIIATLRDVIKHLRSEDEAAVLVFSNQLDFEQDLTANDELLEQAMNGLRPQRGKALLDGIAFAAGHLKRIGKNNNRVLLVISDGRTQSLRGDSVPLSSQVSGVKIYCIGLNADGADQRALLEKLASYSGGQAGFASDPQQFRMLALQMTGFLGVPGR